MMNLSKQCGRKGFKILFNILEKATVCLEGFILVQSAGLSTASPGWWATLKNVKQKIALVATELNRMATLSIRCCPKTWNIFLHFF